MASKPSPYPFEELADKLKQLQEVYAVARDTIVHALIGEELPQCLNCKRLMVPRRAWELHTTSVQRDILRMFMIGTGSHGRCTTCMTYQYREKARNVPGVGRRGPLSEEELLRLQRQVGLA